LLRLQTRNLGGLCEEEPEAYLGILTFMARSARNVKPIPPRTAPRSLGPWSVPEQECKRQAKNCKKIKIQKAAKQQTSRAFLPPLNQLLLKLVIGAILLCRSVFQVAQSLYRNRHSSRSFGPDLLSPSICGNLRRIFDIS
jgi:hypothetical protein